MIYKPIYIQPQKIDKQIQSQIYEGINYIVYKNTTNQIIKQYQFQNVYEMNELLKTIDLEMHLQKQTDLLYAPNNYFIKDLTLSIIYPNFGENINSFISNNQPQQSNQLTNQDIQLYNELIGDEEIIFEQDQTLYRQQLLATTINFKKNLCTTILKLYEMELKGYRIFNIKQNNVFYKQDNLLFMDSFIQSSIFEISLEEYLIIDFVKQQNAQNQVYNLGKIYISLFLMIDFQEQMLDQYLLLIEQYYDKKLYDLLVYMVTGTTQYFAQIVKSEQFLRNVSPIDAIENKILFKEFYESQQTLKNKIWDRIALRFQDDQQSEIWQAGFKQTFSFLQKQKQQPKYRVEYNICTLNYMKHQHQINGTIIINIKGDLNYQRGLLLITQDGYILIYNEKDLLSKHECSKKPLRTVVKHILDKEIHIFISGDDGLIYVFLLNHFFTNNLQPLITLKDSQLKQISSLECYENMIFSGDDSGVINVYKQWQLKKQLTEHKQRISKIKCYNQKIYSSSFDTTIRIWNIHNQEIVQIVTGHLNKVIDFEMIGHNLYSFSSDQMMRVCEYREYKYQFIFQYKFEHNILCYIQYSDIHILLGDQGGHIVLFDLINRKIEYKQKMNTNEIISMNWHSHSQNILITQSRDKVQKILQFNQ